MHARARVFSEHAHELSLRDSWTSLMFQSLVFLLITRIIL